VRICSQRQSKFGKDFIKIFIYLWRKKNRKKENTKLSSQGDGSGAPWLLSNVETKS